MGRRSNLRQFLAKRLPNLTASEHDADRLPGEVDGEVRYEDLTRLSFADRAFDSIICADVLQHISDYKAALRELARVLKRGGRALLTLSWLGGEHYDHMVSAKVSHGARAFGWKLLDELREAGFSQARANYVFGPLHGYMTLNTPVIVGVR